MLYHDRFHRIAIAVELTAAVLVLFGGCDNRGNLGPTGTVSGLATVAGEPLPEGSTIMFMSDRTVIAGDVDANGKYQLESTDSKEVPVGSYRVVVNPPPPPELSEKEEDELMNSGPAPPVSPHEDLIPAEYRRANTSPLIYEIQQGENTIDIEIP